MSTDDELRPAPREGAPLRGTRADETVPAGTGGAGSFDARHGEFTDGSAGAGVDPRTGEPVHGDGTPSDEPDALPEEHEGLDDQLRHRRSQDGRG
ncbi:hypothetical protein OVA14_08775 [Agrococcus sp. SL85]|uniref:hypothetical protein n=1 Tax=Agrococcus sp. SL85 TaxID=2995141 RepID=UPI00226CFA08|nr:hypothetical protein [Agrococcus sp. SL85]WAC65455.1 hypothetical protein OVA14_08775 [Agrococcus sp. SL85]